MEAGLVVFRSRYVQIEPLIGICFNRVFEDYPFRFDPHPNWNLDAKSNWDPTLAIRFNFSFKARDRCQSVHWFIAEWRLTRLNYDNGEYGDGFFMGAVFGYCFDWVVF